MVYSIGSAQINNGFSDQYYFPYSIGLLEAYFRRHSVDPKRYTFLPAIYKRIPLQDAVEQLITCDVVLFSVYVWNINISLAIARELKRLRKDVFIIFGGPSVPDLAKEFLLSNKVVDVACHQEGERTLTSLLDCFPDSGWRDTPGISYLDEAGVYNTNPLLKRMRDISQIPSPYLGGMFDRLIYENPGEKWLVSWETNRGCPFACAFCDWGSAVNSKVSRMDMKKLKAELAWFAEHKIEFIFVCDANFGMLKRDYEIAEYAVAVRKEYGYPHVLSVQTTKNARERSYKIQKLLYDGGLHKSVNLAMQSTNPETLNEIKRGNISIDDYSELQRRFLRDGIPTYSDLIVGLPGDTFDSFVNSIEELISSGQHYRIQFNNLSILPNAEMAQPEYITKNRIQTVQIPIVNMHGSLDDEPSDGICERQDLVVSTKDLPKEDWIRARRYATTAEFFYFNKVLQVPILLCNIYENVPFKNMLLALMNVNNDKKYPVLSLLNEMFSSHAVGITNGEPEFVYSEHWLAIYWPPGEFAIIKLFDEELFEGFYKESGEVLRSVVSPTVDAARLVDESILYNKELMRLPGYQDDLELSFSYDIDSMYRSALIGEREPIEVGEYRYLVKKSDWDYQDPESWARKVIWYGHRSGAYMYGTVPMEQDIAGHY